MLSSVLLQEAVKASSPRKSMAPSTIPPLSAPRIPRRQTVFMGSPSPSMLKKSILKTPATKRRTGRGVVFADLVANTSAATPQRRSQSPMKFICTPMPVDRPAADYYENNENTTPKTHAVKDRRSRASVYSTNLDSPINIMKRLSLSDSPRRSVASVASGKRSGK